MSPVSLVEVSLTLLCDQPAAVEARFCCPCPLAVFSRLLSQSSMHLMFAIPPCLQVGELKGEKMFPRAATVTARAYKYSKQLGGGETIKSLSNIFSKQSS